MTPEEVKDYGERVQAMAKKEPAYHGWGFFYFKSVGTGESYGRKESARDYVSKILANIQR